MQGDLTWTRLKTGSGFPKLKAKAAATRHMMSYGLHLAQTYLAEDRRIVAIAQLMAEFYSLLESEGLHLKQATIDRIMELGGRCVDCTRTSPRRPKMPDKCIGKYPPKCTYSFTYVNGAYLTAV